MPVEDNECFSVKPKRRFTTLFEGGIIMRGKILVLLAALAMTVGFGVSVASEQIWKVDFQGDENHNNTYGQNGPRDYTEPGVYWNIFEVAGFSAVGNTNVSTPPTSLKLLDTEGNDHGVTLTLLTDAWGWANEGTLDDLWGDYLIILNAHGAISDPTDWEITGLTPNTQCELTYAHRANIASRGINFVANGVETTVISTSDGYMATALVTTDSSGKIAGTADSDGYNEGCWAGLVIAIIPTARHPQPADGAIIADTWVTLSWTPGSFAVSHDVYLGDNFDDVGDGVADTFRGNQTSTFYVAGFPGFAYPDGLVPGTTYYWRIDEVDDADPDSPWKGDVWSFSIPPKTAYSPDPADGTEIADVNAPILSWAAGFGAKLHTVYFGDDFDTVSNAVSGMPSGLTTYNPGPLELEKVYYWRVDEFDAVETHKGDVWTFTTPGAVGSPQPANGATDVAMAAVLSWTAADNAASHEVYLGLEKNVVRSADTASPEYKGFKALGAESFDAGLLEPDTTYYWRVDEVSNGNTVKGLVWSFTVGNHLLVDDFESYTDDDPKNQAIWQSWIDGFGIADNGAQVGSLLPPYAEQTIVHSGLQSMPLLYVNEAGVTNSEAALTLTEPRDWTQAGVAELSLWFRGDSANAAEPLYVSAANSAGAPAVVAHNDAAVAASGRWTQWRVPLQAFADQGITLSNVDKLAIGLGSKAGMAAVGGSGTMYIDDIRLYRP